MFRLALSETYPAKVELNLPGDNGKGDFTVTFRRVSQSRLAELSQPDQRTRDVLREVVAGWSELTDRDGAAIPFSPEMLDQVLDVAGVPQALLRAFFSTIAGSREKN